jgi:hypothetical protein
MKVVMLMRMKTLPGRYKLFYAAVTLAGFAMAVAYAIMGYWIHAGMLGTSAANAMLIAIPSTRDKGTITSRLFKISLAANVVFAVLLVVRLYSTHWS